MSDPESTPKVFVIHVNGPRPEARESDHPWALCLRLIDRGVLTPEEARDEIVLAHRASNRRAVGAAQRLIAEATSRGEDVIRCSELNTALALAQIQELNG